MPSRRPRKPVTPEDAEEILSGDIPEEDTEFFDSEEFRHQGRVYGARAGDSVPVTEIQIGDRFSQGFDVQLKKDEFLVHMLTGKSWRESAECSGVPITRAIKWMRSKKMKARLQKCRDILAEQSLTRLATLANSAITAIEDALKPDEKMQNRLQASKLLFDAYSRVQQMVGLENRLLEIEEALGVSKIGLPHHFNKTNLQDTSAQATEAIAKARVQVVGGVDLSIPGEMDDGT